MKKPTHGGARPGSGPKPKPPEAKRSRVLQLPLTPGEEQAIKAAWPEQTTAEARKAVLRAAQRRASRKSNG